MSEKESEVPVEDLTPEEVTAIYKSAQEPDTPDWADETVN